MTGIPISVDFMRSVEQYSGFWELEFSADCLRIFIPFLFIFIVYYFISVIVFEHERFHISIVAKSFYLFSMIFIGFTYVISFMVKDGGFSLLLLVFSGVYSGILLSYARKIYEAVIL